MRKAVVPIEKVKYERLGLNGNPFPSVPLCSDRLTDFFSEKYVEREFDLLRRLVVRSYRTRSSRMVIYVSGVGGCGKSTLFRSFVRKFSSDKQFLPIYCRFPVIGGVRSLYREILMRG